MRTILFFLGLWFSILTLPAQAPSLNWAGRMGGTFTDASNSITTGIAGNAYVIGEFEGTTDADPGPGIISLVSNGYKE